MDNTSQSPNKERGILFEDCSEDTLKSGILTLTNRKLAFEKTKGRIATLSKEMLGEKIEFELKDISQARSEGRKERIMPGMGSLLIPQSIRNFNA